MTSGSSFSLGRRQPTHLISARRAPWKEPKPRAEKAPVWTYNGRERIPPGGTHSTGLVGQWLLPGDTSGGLRCRADHHHERCPPSGISPRAGKELHHLHGFPGRNEEAPTRRARTQPGRSKRNHRAGPRTSGTGQRHRHPMGPGHRGVEATSWPTSTREQQQSQEPRTVGTGRQQPGSTRPSSSTGPLSERQGDGSRT